MGVFRSTVTGLAFGVLCGAAPLSGALAAVPPLVTPDINDILPAASARIVLRTLGVLMNYRAYQGAAPRGITGFDFGLEATLVHLPSNFSSAMSGGSASGGDASSAAGALPSLKLQLHKGLGPKADIGISGLYLRGSYLWGGGLKFTLFEPPEGPSWAARASYSECKITTSSIGMGGVPIPIEGVNAGTADLDVRTRTVSLQVLSSKAFDFAEPYLGLGADWVTGQIEIPVTITVLGEARSQTLVTRAYQAYQFQAFTGVSFRIVPVGIRIAMEGSYSTAGMHTLGTVVGFSF
ncbi:MAG: hypothetical protein NDJ90_15185 [Oligoflexia bacterium]|nr:hypothetical protein [Oligoflexia bacterium]